MNKNILPFTIALVLSYSCAQKSAQKKSIDNIFIKKADSLFQEKSGIKLLFQSSDTSEIETVKDSLSWPSDVGIFYNVVFDREKIVLIKIVPVSESGDYHLVSNYYFNQSKQVVAIKRRVKYFNESCSESAITEESLFENVMERFSLISYSLKNEEGKELDSTTCRFGPNPKTVLYRTLSEIPLYHFLSK